MLLQLWVRQSLLQRSFLLIALFVFLSEARTSWIMPFTAGGFLHISLVTVLPDLLQEPDRKEAIKQFAALLMGIGVMAFMTIVFES